jgi:hypothetical protein
MVVTLLFATLWNGKQTTGSSAGRARKAPFIAGIAHQLETGEMI